MKKKKKNTRVVKVGIVSMTAPTPSDNDIIIFVCPVENEGCARHAFLLCKIKGDLTRISKKIEIVDTGCKINGYFFGIILYKIEDQILEKLREVFGEIEIGLESTIDVLQTVGYIEPPASEILM